MRLGRLRQVIEEVSGHASRPRTQRIMRMIITGRFAIVYKWECMIEDRSGV